MKHENEVHLTGILIKKDPLKQTQEGKSLLSFYIDSYNDYKNPSKKVTLKVVCFGDLATMVSSSISLDTEVRVAGRLSSNPYQSNHGEKKYYTDLIATHVFQQKKVSIEEMLPPIGRPLRPPTLPVDDLIDDSEF